MHDTTASTTHADMTSTATQWDTTPHHATVHHEPSTNTTIDHHHHHPAALPPPPRRSSLTQPHHHHPDHKPPHPHPPSISPPSHNDPTKTLPPGLFSPNPSASSPPQPCYGATAATILPLHSGGVQVCRRRGSALRAAGLCLAAVLLAAGLVLMVGGGVRGLRWVDEWECERWGRERGEPWFVEGDCGGW